MEKMNKEKEGKVKFLTRNLSNAAIFALLLNPCGLGIITIFNVSDKIKTYYYSFYLTFCFVFVILLLIRIPFYFREKKDRAKIR